MYRSRQVNLLDASRSAQRTSSNLRADDTRSSVKNWKIFLSLLVRERGNFCNTLCGIFQKFCLNR